MGDCAAPGTAAARARTAQWLCDHAFDAIVVLLGTVLTLRFWYILFGVQDGGVIAALTAAAVLEAVRCFVYSRRRNIRPQFISSDRRSDLLAAIALATAPWPLTLPVKAASAFWSLCPASTMAHGVRPLCAILVLLLSMRRLQSARR
jgi:hypothetical protein